jgi:hypothetical protein
MGHVLDVEQHAEGTNGEGLNVNNGGVSAGTIRPYLIYSMNVLTKKIERKEIPQISHDDDLNSTFVGRHNTNAAGRFIPG